MPVMGLQQAGRRVANVRTYRSQTQNHVPPEAGRIVVAGFEREPGRLARTHVWPMCSRAWSYPNLEVRDQRERAVNTLGQAVDQAAKIQDPRSRRRGHRELLPDSFSRGPTCSPRGTSGAATGGGGPQALISGQFFERANMLASRRRNLAGWPDLLLSRRRADRFVVETMALANRGEANTGTESAHVAPSCSCRWPGGD